MCCSSYLLWFILPRTRFKHNERKSVNKSEDSFCGNGRRYGKRLATNKSTSSVKTAFQQRNKSQFSKKCILNTVAAFHSVPEKQDHYESTDLHLAAGKQKFLIHPTVKKCECLKATRTTLDSTQTVQLKFCSGPDWPTSGCRVAFNVPQKFETWTFDLFCPKSLFHAASQTTCRKCLNTFL